MRPDAQAPGADALVGRTLGEFVVQEKLGEGGFGAVYRAEQPLLQRPAVIKVLHAQHRASPEIIQRFLREAKLASKLDHPFAAHIYAFGAEPDGLLWIAMELVRGTPLDKTLAARGPLPLEQFVPLLDRICEVLHTAHEQGIVHRDIKPANVMVLVRAGRHLPKLLDFGIAKALDEATPPVLPVKPVSMATPNPDPRLDGDAFAGTLAGNTPSGNTPPRTPPPDSDAFARTLGDSGNTPARPELTRAGAVMGSPPYMAPEQWTNSPVGPRTDLYALGCLAFESLTGRPAFTGSTLMAIARAHAAGRVPPLGEGFPAELDGVLKKAMSRRPDDRYATALELAAAFRTAAGMAGERVALPQIEESLREMMATEAPQPLAESLAQFHGARNVHQAWDALLQVVETVVRLLALVALACRTQTGAPPDGDAPLVRDTLLLLHKRGLTDDEWLRLAAALVQPFVERREVHPIPELVDFLAAQATAHGGPLEALLSLREAHGGRGSELEVQDQMQRALPDVERLLRAVTFLCEYRLVVPRDGVGELWMGLRPPKRRCLPLTGRGVVDGQPLLVSAGRAGEAAPIAQLWPLVQAIAPAPGARQELFLLAGQGRHGARLVAMPSGFERLDPELWDWFREQLFDVAGDGSAAPAEERSPYRGLAAFGPEDAALFFGRESEIDDSLNRLRMQPMLAVVGPSGAGKSSFVHAGILPNLPPGWRAITVRPGPSPLSTLAARLDKEGAPPADLRRSPEALRGQLVALAGEGVVVLVIDQFEELFTLSSDADERTRFAEAVVAAAPSVEGPVRVVFTLRDDFLLRAEHEPALKAHLGHVLQLLTAPTTADLVRILIEPARLVGYDYEDAALPDEMARALAGRPGALPLLSFTAAKLWELRDRHFHQLSRRAYEGMGGVSGALAHHAEDTLAAMSSEEQRLVREAFRHLVTSEGTRAVLTRAELVDVLRPGAATESVIEKLIGARLLAAQEGEGGQDRIEVAHEALLTAWPRLVGWRREDAEGARLRDQLRSAVRQWDERNRPKGLLWRDEALAEYQIWRARHPQPLTQAEEDFARRSIAEAARGRRLRRVALAGAFFALVVGLGTVTQLNRRNKQSAAEARHRLAAFYEEQGRQLLLGGDALRALVYLSESMQLGLDDGDLRFLVARASRVLDAEVLTLGGHGDAVVDALSSPDGRVIITAARDGVARAWDAKSGALLQRFAHPELEAIDLDVAGARLVTSGAGRARVWDVAGGKLLRTIDGLPQRASLIALGARFCDARFSPDGKRLAVINADHTVRIVDAGDGKTLLVLRGHGDEINSARFSSDGKRLITASADTSVRSWDLATGRALMVYSGHSRPVYFAVESPDGSRVLGGGDEHAARLWNARTGALVGSFKHQFTVWEGAFSPDSSAFVVRGDVEPQAQVWDAQHGLPLATLNGHKGPLMSIEFSADSKRLVTASTDGTAKLWDVGSGRMVSTLVGHDGEVVRARWSPDDTRVITSGRDHSARVWDPRPAGLRFNLPHPGAVYDAHFTPDGTRILTSADDQKLRVFSRDGKLLSTATPLADATLALWGADDTRALVIHDRTLALWDMQTMRPTASMLTAGGFTWAELDGDNRQIIAAFEDGTARVWDVEGKLLHTLSGHGARLGYAGFSADGRRITTASDDGTARLWDGASGKVTATLVGHNGRVESAAFSPDGKTVVTTGFDQTVRLWDGVSGKLRAPLVGHINQLQMARFSHDGELIASAGLDGFKIWSVRSGRLLDEWQGGSVYAARFSPDDELLVSANYAPDAAGVWDSARDRRSAADIARLVRCRVPFRLQGDVILPAPVDPAACVAR